MFALRKRRRSSPAELEEDSNPNRHVPGNRIAPARSRKGFGWAWLRPPESCALPLSYLAEARAGLEPATPGSVHRRSPAHPNHSLFFCLSRSVGVYTPGRLRLFGDATVDSSRGPSRTRTGVHGVANRCLNLSAKGPPVGALPAGPTRASPDRSGVVRQQAANCTRVGTYGSTSSRMRASCGVRSALRRLHFSQAATVFSHDHGPPRLAGSTWSIVVALAPQ